MDEFERIVTLENERFEMFLSLDDLGDDAMYALSTIHAYEGRPEAYRVAFEELVKAVGYTLRKVARELRTGDYPSEDIDRLSQKSEGILHGA